MPRICFVSYEIFPTTRGGCGTLLHNAARVLLERGHEVVFVLDVPREYFERFRTEDRLALPHADRCRAYHVDALCEGMDRRADEFLTDAQWRAWRFHVATAKVAELERPDVIEFFDYCGVAHYALAAKVAGLAYADSMLTVRLHNSLELMDLYEPTKPLDLERHGFYALEHSSLQMAEAVVHPSPSYLERAYRPHYEEWFGRQVLSRPPLVEIPARTTARPDADAVLFYGRLFGFKGVDRFVDAAVALLAERPGSGLRFLLVGHDSRQAPDGSPSCQEYLRRKIPAAHQGRFVFTDHLDWRELGEVLPSVLFAVFPSYLEAFCYAAHELYAAGVPVVVSDIPNFQDYFEHERNALVFDGSVGDLVRQMVRLADDGALRRRLTFPFPVAPEPLGDFYDGPFPPGWIVRGPAARPSLLACVLADDESVDVARTIGALAAAGIAGMRVVVLEPAHGANGVEPLWLLGALRAARDPDGARIPASALTTAETLVVLRAGDEPSPAYLATALDVLARQREIGFVASWKRVTDGERTSVQTFPLDAVPELVPFLGLSPLSRAVIRTPPGRMMIDLFDLQAGVFGELMYLWRLEAAGRRGLVVPAPLVAQRSEAAVEPSPNTFAYLVMQDSSPGRHARLARYLVTVWSALRDVTGSGAALRFGPIAERDGADPALAERYRAQVADRLDGRTLLRLALRKLRRKVRDRVEGGREG